MTDLPKARANLGPNLLVLASPHGFEHEQMTSPAVQANALAALERARQAQERHDRRVDVQLRFWTVQEQLDAELADTVQAVRAERVGLQGSR